MPFVCEKPCWHNGKKYAKGDPARFSKAKDGPKDKNGKLNHFIEVDSIPSAGDEVADLTANVKRLENMVKELAEAATAPDAEEEIPEGGPDPPEGNAPAEVTCDVCNEYKGNAQQVASHRPHCLKKQTANQET
jgi:hypothetical protein